MKFYVFFSAVTEASTFVFSRGPEFLDRPDNVGISNLIGPISMRVDIEWLLIELKERIPCVI